MLYMAVAIQDIQKNFFRDNSGHIVLWQWPNAPLYGWISTKLVSMIVPNNHLKTGLSHLGMASLFTWAYLELTKGVNYFRRILGFLVLSLLIVSYLQK